MAGCGVISKTNFWRLVLRRTILLVMVVGEIF